MSLDVNKLSHGSQVSFHLPLWVPDFDLSNMLYELCNCGPYPDWQLKQNKTNFPFMYKQKIIIKEGKLKDYSKLHTHLFAVSSCAICDNWLKYWFVEFLL